MNFYPSGVGIKRMGYSGFLSLIVMIFRINRNAKQLGIKAKIELTVPMRWLA